MMNTLILEKTEKGRAEISTRANNLAPRLRSLLVLVDGKTHADDLLRKLTGLGLNETSLRELEHGGFIHPCAVPTSPDRPDTASVPSDSPAPVSVVSRHVDAALLPPSGGAAVASATEVECLLAIQRFYNATIREAIGLRGLGLQLKVERAATLDDYRALRQPYLDAIAKSKGQAVSETYAGQLDKLLADCMPNNF